MNALHYKRQYRSITIDVTVMDLVPLTELNFPESQRVTMVLKKPLALEVVLRVAMKYHFQKERLVQRILKLSANKSA